MEQKLVLGMLELGSIGWACLVFLLLARPRVGVAASQTSPELTAVETLEVRRDFVWLAFLLPVFVWLATLPVHAPFSSGQGWGRGFLLGGLLAFLNIGVLFRAFSRRGPSVPAAGALALFSALVGAGVPLLWMRSAVIEALLGEALAWMMVSLIWLMATRAPQSELNQGQFDGFATLILNGAGFAAALLATAALGVYRDFVVADVTRGTYPALALALAGSVALAFLIIALLGAITTLSTPARTFLALLAPLGAAYLLTTRFTDDLTPFYVVAIGLVLGGLWWLLAHEAPHDAEMRPARVPLPAAIVTLCGFMLAYQILQGFGVGLMLLAAWPASLLALPARVETDSATQRDGKFEVAQVLSLLGAFVAILLVSRLFATRFRADLRGASLEDQFALFGFLAGAVVPCLLAAWWFEARQNDSRSLWRLFPASDSASETASLARLFCVGVLALLLPGAMLLLWGAKIVPAFLLGLGLSILGFQPALARRGQSGTAALFALALSFTISQWTQRFLPLAEVSRAQRMQFLIWSLASVITLILVVDYGARLVFWLRNRPAPKTGVSL